MSRQTVTRSFQRISFHYNQLTDNLNRLTCNIYLWEDRQLYVNIIRFCLLICLGWNLSVLRRNPIEDGAISGLSGQKSAPE